MKSICNAYFNELRQFYSKENVGKLLLVKIAVVLSPVFAELGIRMLSPLAIVVNTLKEAEMILYALNGLGPCKISTIAETQKKIEKFFMKQSMK